MSKSARVVQLRQEKQPDESLVTHLEQLLKEARSGDIVGLIAAADYGQGEHGYFGGGSLVNNPAQGMLATTRLWQRFL